MVHHGIVKVCTEHREVSHGGNCPVCGRYDLCFSSKWRAPKKNNDKAWKRIAEGDYLWEHPKGWEDDTNPRTEAWRRKIRELWRRKNPKHGLSELGRCEQS